MVAGWAYEVTIILAHRSTGKLLVVLTGASQPNNHIHDMQFVFLSLLDQQ